MTVFAIVAPKIVELPSTRKRRFAISHCALTTVSCSPAAVTVTLFTCPAMTDGGSPSSRSWLGAPAVTVTAELDFDEPGRYEVLGIARLDNRLVAAISAAPVLRVPKDDPIPDVGDRAPVIETPTETDVGGDLEHRPQHGLVVAGHQVGHELDQPATGVVDHP